MTGKNTLKLRWSVSSLLEHHDPKPNESGQNEIGRNQVVQESGKNKDQDPEQNRQ
jgi:hypothetical protein